MLRCNPLNRPNTNELRKSLSHWDFNYHMQAQLTKQVKEAEEINNRLLINNIPSTSLALSYKTHPEAIYTSRLLDFGNLPEPKNSDDYYKQYDNISPGNY